MRRILSLLLVMVMTATVMLLVVPPIEVKAVTLTPSSVKGSDFTDSEALAEMLDIVFSGDIDVYDYTNQKVGKEVSMPLGMKMSTNDYYITDKTSKGGFSGGECYIYANAVYNKLFNEVVYHGGNKHHSIEVISNASNTASFKMFNDAKVRCGAYMRTTANKDGSYHGQKAHSMIILSYNEKTITYLGGNQDASRVIDIRCETWEEFNKERLSGCDRYIDHVVQPKDAYYESLYPSHKCTQFTGLGVCTECNKTFNWEKTFDNTAAGTYTVVSNFTPRTNAPYNDATQASTSIKKGDTVDVIGAYTNAYGSKFYKFTYSSGKSTGYVYETYLSFSKPNALSVQCTEFKPSSNASLPQGQTYTASGTISSNYPLKTVEAYLDGSKYTTWTASNQKTTSLSIASTVISSKLNFANMSLGAHTIKLKATDIHNQTSTFLTVSFNIVNNPTNNVLRINYNANGGTVTGSNYYLSSSMVYLKSSSKPVAGVYQYGVTYTNGLHNDTTFGLVREGYEFVGWSLTADGSGVIFDQDMPFKPEDLVPELINGDKTVTMYAIWEKVGCDHNYHIKDDSYDTNFKAFPYAKITNDNLFDADHNKMNANNWIAATDECTILEVYTDGCCKVTYPLDSGGTRTLYSKISLFNIVYDEWKANDFNTYTFNTGEIKRFSYTPSDSGVHFLDAASFNYKNFKVCLYDKEGNELKSDMADYIYAEYDLTAGEKYIFTLQFEDTSISNSSIACHFGRIYKLSYHANGGSGAPATQQRKFNERETISNKKPTRDGYTFKGWSTNSSATTATYQPGDTFSTKADTTLYAVWAKGCENNAHNYDYDCDTTCNTCGHTRTITHSYDNDCDTDCNICGKTRDVKHVYDAYDYDFYNHWKVCSICGAIGGTPERHSVPSLHKLNDTRHFGNCTTCRLELVYDHTYTNDCDTSCNGCEHTRKIEHTYDNNCDTDCNVCGETRSTQHVYDDEEDTTCNICNDVRTVETLPTTTPEPETNPNTKPNVEPNTKPNTNNNNQSNSKDEDDDDDINQTTIIIIASAVTISAVSIFGTALVIKKKR